MTLRSTRRRQLLLAGAASAFGRLAYAQPAPADKLVTIVNPYPAGNPGDLIARRLQPLLAKALRQTVVVENISGAAGTLGVTKVQSLAPDGSTVLMSTPSELILSPLTIPNTRYKPLDFRMVGLFGRAPYILVSRPDLPQASVADIIALKNTPNARPLSYGSPGLGSNIHLVSAQFGKATGVPLLHVPYRGISVMMQDLLGGQVDLGFVPINGSVMSFVEQGKLRAYGIAAKEPYPLHPNIKPLPAQHSSLAGFLFDTWGGFHLPRAVPEAAAQRLNRAFYESIADVEFRMWARSIGMELAPHMTTKQLDEFYRREVVQYQALAKAIGVVN